MHSGNCSWPSQAEATVRPNTRDLQRLRACLGVPTSRPCGFEPTPREWPTAFVGVPPVSSTGMRQGRLGQCRYFPEQ